MSDDFEDDDALFFADEGEDQEEAGDNDRWKVLIVDDESEIHSVTRLVLDQLLFMGKGIQMISAHSGAEARQIISDDHEIGLILLDVVMETDHAGLDVVKYIREELKNKNVRIILRTGQPGQAPERDVIENYDINDYKNKTELTSEKLFTLTYAGLRSYSDIMHIVRSQRGLEKVVEASKGIFEASNRNVFATKALQTVSDMIINENSEEKLSGIFTMKSSNDGHLKILSAQEDYALFEKDGIPKEIEDELTKCFAQRDNIYGDNGHFMMYLSTKSNFEHVLALKLPRHYEFDDLDANLFSVFTANVNIALDNVYLNREIEETAREMVYRLGEAVETRSKETGNHVKRVALISELLAKKIGLEPMVCELIKLASPMHDLGKISIPDSVLNKPGKLDGEEWEVMKSHAQIGYEILKGSKRAVLEFAATIAHEHHEKWNGTGYPRGLKAKEIDIAGRITAVADVFDALASDRCYKKAWPLDKVLALFREERGESFDPELVDILLRDLDEFVAIRDKYKDS